jgi:hypothetical protein
VAAGGISLLGSVFIPWLSVKKEKPQEREIEEKRSAEQSGWHPEAENRV